MSVLVTHLGAGPIPAIAPPVPAAKEASFSDDDYAKDLVGQNQAQAAAAKMAEDGQRFYSEAAQARAMAAKAGTAAAAPTPRCPKGMILTHATDAYNYTCSLASNASELAGGGFFARHGTKLLVGAGVLAVGGLVTWMLLKPTRGLRPAMAGLHGRRRRGSRGRHLGAFTVPQPHSGDVWQSVNDGPAVRVISATNKRVSFVDYKGRSGSMSPRQFRERHYPTHIRGGR